MATCASLSTADEALHATDEKANFERLARLLMCGGHTLLREVFDSIHPPANLTAVLSNPATIRQLQMLRKSRVLTQPEWDCLYLPTGICGKSADFDISLLFKLLRNFCGLTPPATGWDSLPNVTDHSREADLARIKYYRNSIYGHNHRMEITDADFDQLWSEISEALLRIAGCISIAKRGEWKKAIDKFLHDPLTPDAEQYVAELRSWCKNDMETKDEVEKLGNKVEQMDIKLEQMYLSINIIVQSLTTSGSSISPAIGQLLPNIPQVQDTRLQSESVSIPIPSEQPQTGGPTEPPGYRELQQNPSTVLDFWHVVYSFKKSIETLLEYLRKKLGVDVQDDRLGSLVITVSCSSLEVLKGLWKDYRSGHLNKVVQETLVTKEVLEKLDCISEVKLKTIICDTEYKACKKFLKKSGQMKKGEEIARVPAMVKPAASKRKKGQEITTCIRVPAAMVKSVATQTIPSPPLRRLRSAPLAQTIPPPLRRLRSAPLAQTIPSPAGHLWSAPLGLKIGTEKAKKRALPVHPAALGLKIGTEKTKKREKIPDPAALPVHPAALGVHPGHHPDVKHDSPPSF